METLKPEIARLFAAKEARCHKLAALPFAEKVRIVVRLQQMRHELSAALVEIPYAHFYTSRA